TDPVESRTPSDARKGRVRPMTSHSQGIVDPLDFSSVLERQEQGGVTLTFTVSTDVTGRTDKVSALTLKNQVRDAKARLVEAGRGGAEASARLEPGSGRGTDSSYWRPPSRGRLRVVSAASVPPVQ